MQKQKSPPATKEISPLQFTLPGKILTILICFLPFLTRLLHTTISDAIRDAYFLSTNQVTDFEQLIRVIGLLFIVLSAALLFVLERLKLKPLRPLPRSRLMLVVCVLLGIYLLLGLLSCLFASDQSVVWWGTYMIYEGYFALIGYVLLFAAAFYYLDRKELWEFAVSALTLLSILLGIMAVFENADVFYYNIYLVHLLSGLSGYVGAQAGVALTFGNPDYLGMFAAMLMPLMTAILLRERSLNTLLVRIAAWLCLAMTLWLTHVANTIFFGFGFSVLCALTMLFKSDAKRILRLSVPILTAAAVILGSFAYVYTHPGDTLSDKLRGSLVGISHSHNYNLMAIDFTADTVTLRSDKTAFSYTIHNGDPANMTYQLDGVRIDPRVNPEGKIFFDDERLSNVYQVLEENHVKTYLGYATPVETVYDAQEGWYVIGIGGTALHDHVPLVSDNIALRQFFPYLNGRIFVWCNTLNTLRDCFLIGHGPSTALLTLNQQDLPAQLNIFGSYTLYNKPHSWYLQIAHDTGIPSLICIILILGIFIIYGLRRIFPEKRKPTGLQCGLFFSVICYLCCAMMNDSLIYHAPMFWFLLGFAWRTLQDNRTAAGQ